MNAIDRVLINTDTSVPVKTAFSTFSYHKRIEFFAIFVKYNSIPLNQQCLLISLTDRVFENKQNSTTTGIT